MRQHFLGLHAQTTKNVYLNLIDTKGHCYVHLGSLNMSLQQVLNAS